MVRGRAFRFPFCSPTSPMSPPGMRYQGCDMAARGMPSRA